MNNTILKQLRSLFCLVTLGFTFAHAMEPAAVSDDLKMVSIIKFQDAEPFQGKIVAFTLNDGQYCRANCYPSNYLNPQLKYGYILMNDASGFVLIQIVETGTQGFCQLYNHYLEKEIALRCASTQELIAVHQNIKNNNDKFVFSDNDLGLELLEKQSGFELQKRKLQ